MNRLFKGYGSSRAAISLFIFLTTLLLPNAVPALTAEGGSYLEELITAARKKELYRERYWDVLLHYKHGLTGTRSLIDDPRFFLSPEGRKDPKSELEATLSSFFRDDVTDDSHPRCRFIARYRWLAEKLEIDENGLPPVSCNEFDVAYGKIKPRSAVLVFPSAYINGPASTFGHTLIRIDGDYQSKLLSYAATYAADAHDKNGLLYAFKGIFGYYHGYFTILPYYDKIKEYNDLEQRDIWEYRLNLTEEEVSKMLLHLWELKDIYSYYYFFDENCSYILLFLLEAARPSLHLTDNPGIYVIPIDTVRSAIEEGLIETVDYRPSKGTKIRHIASLLDDNGQTRALRIIDSMKPAEHLDDLPSEDRIRTLDLAVEMVQLRYNKEQLTKEEYQAGFLNILKSRSGLGKPDDGQYRIETPVRPDEGHGSGRLSLGLGYSNSDFFQDIRYRAAQHELSDPDEGYIEGSEIVFFAVSARNIPAGEGLRLESLDIIDIVSISPRDRFFKPVSWKVKTGFKQKLMDNGDDELVYHLNPGGGFAIKNKPLGLIYFMLETDLNLGWEYRERYSLGMGPSIGIIREITDFWKMNITSTAVYYGLGDDHNAYNVSAGQVFRISRDNSLNLDLSWKREFDEEQREIRINWHIYL